MKSFDARKIYTLHCTFFSLCFNYKSIVVCYYNSQRAKSTKQSCGSEINLSHNAI